MKIRIKVTNNLGEFYSPIMEKTEEEYRQISDALTNFSSLSSFSLSETDDDSVTNYFGSELLKNSIITLEILDRAKTEENKE